MAGAEVPFAQSMKGKGRAVPHPSTVIPAACPLSQLLQ